MCIARILDKSAPRRRTGRRPESLEVLRKRRSTSRRATRKGSVRACLPKCNDLKINLKYFL